MKIYQEFGFDDLMENCWSGAIPTLETIQENEKEEELMNFLERYFECDDVSLTQVNDLLWFEDTWIFENLGIENHD